tara:strand:+ start:233 stop:1153 length:921 start_codon:yes stop_codon:yes gene_type:complete
MSKKIVFMGTPEFSAQTLETLVNSNYKIECVYTQPPKKSSRGQKVKSSPIQQISEKMNLNIRTPNDLNSTKEFDYFKSLNAYLVIVVAYGKIIPKKYLELSEKGFINIHASLLPKWRGAAPIQRAIINQDLETGISVMKIEEGLDEGPYMRQIKVKIDKDTSAKDLSDKLSILGAENIMECISLIELGKAKFISQDYKKATYAKKINKSESRISWKEKAKNIISLINGLNPHPGAWFEHNKTRYKIWKALMTETKGKPGEVLDESLSIGCEDGSIKILEIQKEGKKKLSVSEFLAGTKITKGTLVF